MSASDGIDTLAPYRTDQQSHEQMRDAAGRLPGAPAWSGDVTALSDELLHHRVEALGSHIGRLFTIYSAMDGSWRPATPAEIRDRELDRWVAVRLVALREQETRRGGAER